MTLDEWGTKTRLRWVDRQVVDKYQFILNGQSLVDTKVDKLLNTLLEYHIYGTSMGRKEEDFLSLRVLTAYPLALS